MLLILYRSFKLQTTTTSASIIKPHSLDHVAAPHSLSNMNQSDGWPLMPCFRYSNGCDHSYNYNPNCVSFPNEFYPTKNSWSMNYGHRPRVVGSEYVTNHMDSNLFNRRQGYRFEQLKRNVHENISHHSSPFLNCSTGYDCVDVSRSNDGLNANAPSRHTCSQHPNAETRLCMDKRFIDLKASIVQAYEKDGSNTNSLDLKVTRKSDSPKLSAAVTDKREMSVTKKHVTNVNTPQRRPLFSPISGLGRDQNSVTPKASNRSYSRDKRRTLPRPYPRDYKPDFK
jgi:hypothetical protein